MLGEESSFRQREKSSLPKLGRGRVGFSCQPPPNLPHAGGGVVISSTREEFPPHPASPCWGRSRHFVNERRVPFPNWGGVGWGFLVNPLKSQRAAPKWARSTVRTVSQQVWRPQRAERVKDTRKSLPVGVTEKSKNGYSDGDFRQTPNNRAAHRGDDGAKAQGRRHGKGRAGGA